MYIYDKIKAVHIELTENCQAGCPMCPRTGNSRLTMSELKLEDIKKIFHIDLIKQLDIISLCGNFGEPIVASDCLEIVQYFRSHNDQMYISINTNAGARGQQWWSQLAQAINKKGTVIFGIDGLEDTNHIYRVNVKWNNAISNAKHFIEAGGLAKWDFIAFEHNEHQIESARQISEEMGFVQFRVKKSYRFGLYQNVNLKPSKTYFNDNNLKVSNLAETNNEVHCVVLDKNEVYLSATGHLFPCCWTGGTVYNDVGNVFDLVDKDLVNTHNYSIQHIINNKQFDKIVETWYNQHSFRTCHKFCGKNNNLLESQFK
jgi:MoaA/NifB/PqqE/SkfB family radical SAM enzyme